MNITQVDILSDSRRVDPVTSAVKCLIDGNTPGVLTTVDERGYPHARWMATLAFESFPLIYTLTGPDSQKLHEIAHHPKVSWMFTDSQMSLIVNLFGTAHVVSDMDVIQRVWHSIEDKSHAYFLRKFGGSEGCAVLETTVERIECHLPERNIKQELRVDFIAETD